MSDSPGSSKATNSPKDSPAEEPEPVEQSTAAAEEQEAPRHVDPVAGAVDEATPERGEQSTTPDNLNDTITKTFGFVHTDSAQPGTGEASAAGSVTPAAASPNASAPPGTAAAAGAAHGDALEDFVATMRTGGPLSDPRMASSESPAPESGADGAGAAPAGLSRRNRKSFKLQEAPLGPRTSTIDNLMLTASPTRAIVCPPMQIRPSAVSDTAAKVQARPASVPSTLPSPLPAPMAYRCDFCIKFDSVCSQCHFKWKKTELKARHAALMAFLKGQSESSRVLAFFASIASGSYDFVEATVNAFPDAIHWNAHFCGGAVRDDRETEPERGSSGDVAAKDRTTGAADDSAAAAGPGKRAAVLQPRPLNPAIDTAGRVFALHVAMAADRVDVARLLIERGAPFRRSDANVLPLDLLPSPPPQRWTDALGALSAYKVHVLCERSKALRKEDRYDEAEALYLEALGVQHSSEHALCGLAKMAFDGANYAEAIKRCDEVLARQAEVSWGQFGPQTVELLRQHAREKLHEVSHGQRGPALRACGCVILDYVRVPIRRLPFKLLRQHVVPFMDCIDAAAVHTALRKMPLVVHALAGHAAALHPEFVFRWIMSEKENAERVVAELRRNVPEPDHVRTEGPVAFRGFRVFAVADFNAVIVTSYAEMVNAAAAKKKESVWSFGKKKEQLPKTLWFAKQYQLSRVKVSEPWTISAAGEWESVQPPTRATNASSATSTATSAAPSTQASPGK
uniref:Uncharacterized protein n=1 Tax=Neobodo designis TaxID=312471 RepID=A0A7S1M2W3_NEODS|mmetsp:Transcript_33226/g.102581  ORF Transcript_33226/g.102581 Transcript_33226/m.102581 type:complete len:739 (+) Transcript_33226:29-2245(+)